MTHMAQAVDTSRDGARREALRREYFGESGFHHFGYWTPETDSPSQAAENLIEQLLAPIERRGGALLDVSCGMGATTRYLARYFDPARIVGVNGSEEQCAACRPAAPECRFLAMDAARLSFPEAAFDVVFSAEAAFQFRTREQFLREAYRVLRAEGQLTLSDVLYAAWAETQGRALHAENHLPHPEAYRAMLEGIGFRKIVVRDVTEVTWEGHVRHLTRFLREKLLSGAMDLKAYNKMMFTHYKHSLPAVRYYLLVSAQKV